MKKNKILVITIIVFLILAITGGAFAYLYVKTDIFKSGKELFGKYFSQEIDRIQKMTDFETISVYQNLNNENKYESITNVKTTYSEGGEISNPLNNLSAKLDMQKDGEQNYFYANGKVLLKEEEIVEEQTVEKDNIYLQAEIIKQDEQYGIRFTDAVKQFVTIKADENLSNNANEIGIKNNLLETIINIIDGTEDIITKEKINEIIQKYLNIITTEMLNGNFEKQRNAIITYNNLTTKTNAYSVSLTSEQVTNILVQILNNLKTETDIIDKISLVYNKDEILNKIDNEIKKINEEIEIPAIKITVYEQNEVTIRTVVEIGQDKIIIENTNQNGELKTIFNYSKLNNEQIEEYKIEIKKINTQYEEKIEVIATVTQGDQNSGILFSSVIAQSENEIKYNLKFENNEDITTKAILLENNIKIDEEFEKMLTLQSGNYVTLSDMQDENKKQQLIDLLKQIVPQKTNERINELKTKLNLIEEVTDAENVQQSETGISQTDTNKFNSQFEFYIGNEVSAESVKTLLDIAKNHLKSYEISENADDKKVNIKLNIEKDVINENVVIESKEKIKDQSKYKIMISYKEGTGVIDYITISEV